MSDTTGDDAEYTIGRAAEILGVTPRTLRHWEAVGLLEPQWRTLGDYRLYTPEDVERGLQIVVYRAAGVPLAQIGELIDAPGTRRERLHRQREILVDRIAHLRGMIRVVDEILEGDAAMGVEQQAKKWREQWSEYRAEAQERWGNTPEWEQSRERMRRMTAGDWEEATPSKQVILARMYVADDRFARSYGEHRGYLRDLVEARAAKEGVDLYAVQWR